MRLLRNIRHDGPLWAAARVAAVATAIAAVLYASAVAGLIVLEAHGAAQRQDTLLELRLHQLQIHPQLLMVHNMADLSSSDQDGPPPGPPGPGPRARLGGQPPRRHLVSSDEGSLATVNWLVMIDGSQFVSPGDAPTLPANLQHVTGPVTASIDGSRFRLVGGPLAQPVLRPGNPLPEYGSWLVVGAPTGSIDFWVWWGTIVGVALGIPILALTFLAALAIGRWSAAPIERGRRRVLEFTADASHELRTPLQVIEAEVSLALMQERDAASYRETIESVRRESGRLRHMVDDLLWLARFDSRPGSPRLAAVDLRALAADAVQRFDALAQRKRQTLRQTDDGRGPALVLGPPEWLDRLLGVLIDNACRYTPEGGSIVVGVQARDGQVELRVEDSGPGIPVEERGRIFDRFRRASDQGGGAGLGLAIGNAVVTATQGRWRVGDSPLGGACISVSWPAARGGSRQRGGEPVRRPVPETAGSPERHPI